MPGLAVGTRTTIRDPTEGVKQARLAQTPANVAPSRG